MDIWATVQPRPIGAFEAKHEELAAFPSNGIVTLTISQKIALPTMALVLLLQISLGAVALDHERQALLAQLDDRAADLAHISEASVSAHQPGTIEETAKKLGQTLLDEVGVASCRIEASDDSLLFKGCKETGEETEDYSFSIALAPTPDANGQVTASDRTATLAFSLTRSGIDETLAQAKGVVIVAILAGMMTSVLFVTLIVRHAMGKRPTDLRRRIATISRRHETSEPWPAHAEGGDIAPPLLSESDESRAQTVATGVER